MAKRGEYLDFDLTGEIDEALRFLDAVNPAVDRAVDRAVKKTVKVVRRELMRSLAKSTGISQKAFKYRLKDSYIKKNRVGYLWLGLNPIPAHFAGKPRQNKSGVRVRGKTFKHAFLSDVYSDGEQKVWRRKYRGKGAAAQAGSGGSGFVASSAGRFPLELMVFDIDELGVDEVRRMEPKFKKRFSKILNQEIDYALLYEGSK